MDWTGTELGNKIKEINEINKLNEINKIKKIKKINQINQINQLVDLVWLNRASIPNFSFIGSLEVAQNYFPQGWVGVGGSIWTKL